MTLMWLTGKVQKVLGMYSRCAHHQLYAVGMNMIGLM